VEAVEVDGREPCGSLPRFSINPDLDLALNFGSIIQLIG